MGEKNFGRVHKTLGQYAAVPTAVLDDTRVSDVAVRVAAQLSRRINYGAWNTDGRVDMSYVALAAKVGKSRWTVMRAVRELVEIGHLAPPQSLKRGGMRFWFNTGWSDEDEDGYNRWATTGFRVEAGQVTYTGFSADAPYSDALENGFPTIDPRSTWVQRAKDSLTRWAVKFPKGFEYPAARVYAYAIREHMKTIPKDDIYTDEGAKRYEETRARLAHNGPNREDVDKALRTLRNLDREYGTSSADATATNTSGPSRTTATVLAMMGKSAEPTPISSAEATDQ